MTIRFGDWLSEEMVAPLLKREKPEEPLDLVPRISLGCPGIAPVGKPVVKWHQHTWVAIPSSIIYLLNEVEME